MPPNRLWRRAALRVFAAGGAVARPVLAGGKNATPVVPASVAGAFHAGLGDTIDIVVAVVLGKAEGDSSIDPVTKC